MMYRREFIRRFGGLAAAAYLMPSGLRLRGQTSLPSVATSDNRGLFPNLTPLESTPYIALPLGSVRASGWLLKQLEIQRDGLTGHAEELGEWLPALQNSAWAGGNGDSGEKGPYYLKGLVSLAYVLDDDKLKKLASRWIEPILASQQPDGFFGPKGTRDWWPRMVVTYLLRDFQEATGDPRVIPFLQKYYGYLAQPDRLKECLAESGELNWGKARAADEIDTILWVYNRTGDASLLSLATQIRDGMYDWSRVATQDHFLTQEILSHNVNIPQMLKRYGLLEVLTKGAGKDSFLAAELALDDEYGLGLGVTAGNEHVDGRGPNLGVETCSIVEKMLSLETNLRVFGEAGHGDTLERLAFNLLPAAVSDDIHQHVYYTRPNHPTAHMGGSGYWQDYPDAFCPSPQSGCPCCCYNFHMGWPKYVQNAWAATADGGLAVLAYAPNLVSAKVKNGAPITIAQETDYPFGETIRLKVSAPSATQFPLELRVPGWCATPQITVGGLTVPNVQPGSFARIDRVWKDGDEVVATFPMKIRAREGYLGAIMIDRGPIIYSLQIGAEKKVIREGQNGFDRFELTPRTPWNYALAVDPANPDASISVQSGTMPDNPFVAATTPVQLLTKGRRLSEWTFGRNGMMAAEPPVSPVESNESDESLTLIPFGTQFLRMTWFPYLGTPLTPAASFSDDFSKPTYYKNWGLYGGGWYLDEGALVCRSQNPAKIVALGATFTDLRYEVEVFPPAKGDAGLIFRGSRFDFGGNDFNGYYVGLSAEKNSVMLGKSDGDYREIKKVSFDLTPDQSYHVRVEASGQKISVYVSDMAVPLLEAEDDKYASGAIGLRLWSPKYVQARFKNVSAQVL
jgi:Beta-L-arabinofuranosidase, GH127